VLPRPVETTAITEIAALSDSRKLGIEHALGAASWDYRYPLRTSDLLDSTE
jgi:hypothetical protein